MLFITPTLQIPDEEFTWSFARSGGPGGQNVNKVASKAVLRWNLAVSNALPHDVKSPNCSKTLFTLDGELIITSQLTRSGRIATTVWRNCVRSSSRPWLCRSARKRNRRGSNAAA